MKYTMEEKLDVEYVVTQVCNWMFRQKRIKVSPKTYVIIQNALIKEIKENQ